MGDGRRPARLDGRRRIQACRPRADLPQIHLRRLRGEARRTRRGAGPGAPTRRTQTSTAPRTFSGYRRRPAGAISRRRRNSPQSASSLMARWPASSGTIRCSRTCCPRTTPARPSTSSGSASSSTWSATSWWATRTPRSKDVLGRVYEYFLSQFASAEGKKGGEFYTPRCVVKLLVEMLEPYKGRVYDPCCGSSGMFVQSVAFIDAHATGNGNGGKGTRRYLDLRSGVEPHHLADRADEPRHPRHRGADCPRRQLP